MQPHHIETVAPYADVRCPRCGYDQRGVVATWTDSCPLKGTCAECGLIFHWRNLLVPVDRAQGWSVEHAPSLISLPWRTIRTLAMMAMPWQFWTQMQMHHPVRIAPVLAMYALIGTFVVAVSVAAGDPVIRSYFGWFRGIEFAILTGQFKIYPRHVTVPLICIAALMPLGFVALPVSRKTAKVQWRHILRITAYSFAPLALLVLFERLLALAVDQFGYQPWLKWTPPMIKMLRFAIVPLFLVLWWAFGINQYLKMRHGLGIAVAMFSMAALGFALSMAVGTMIDDV